MSWRQRLTRAFVFTLHSFMFAAAPVAVFLAAGTRIFPLGLSDGGRSLVFAGLANLVLLSILAVWRGARSAAVTLSSFYIALAFYPSAVALRLATARSIPEGPWAAGFAAVCFGFALWLGRRPRGEDRRYRTLNVAGGAILVVCAVIVVFEQRASAHRPWGPIVEQLSAAAPTPRLMPEQPADVFYIILDGMGREDVLHREYALDLSADLRELERFGWVVSGRSRANYPQTYSSIASALSGTYLDELSVQMGGSLDRRPLYELIQRSATLSAFRSHGYSLSFIGSNTSVSAFHRQADRCFCDWPGLTEFENGLLTMTVAGALPLYRPTYGGHYQTVMAALDVLDRLADSSVRQIVVAHIMLPHPPFVLRRDGQAVVKTGPVVLRDGDHYAGTKDEYRTGYREQAAYVLRRLTRFAQRVQRRPRPTAVIVHGDHGPGLDYSHVSPTLTGVRERFPIFMATRLPSRPPTPDDLSPVNVLRFLMNAEFGSRYPLLENHSYYAPWEAPYRFTEVQVQ